MKAGTRIVSKATGRLGTVDRVAMQTTGLVVQSNQVTIIVIFDDGDTEQMLPAQVNELSKPRFTVADQQFLRDLRIIW